MKLTVKKISLLLTLGFFISLLTIPSLRAFAEEKYKELQIFAKVLNLIQKYYVVEVDPKKLIDGGIKGMLAELDPHTNYLPPDIYKEFKDETSGEFGGIGIEIGVQDEALTIVSPIEDAPAFKAGIKAGDKITSINGESTKGWSLVEAAQKMKGKDGEVIHIGIMRKGFVKSKIFDIRRGRVRLKSVKVVDLGDGYSYVRITSFIESTYADFEKFIQTKIKTQGLPKGIVIDLRNNPGGLFDQAVKLSDLFLSSGTIVTTRGRNHKEEEVTVAKKEGTLENFPIIIVVNEYTASASEIFSGAMQDNDRALILGQKTFGKGSVQSVIDLGDGSGLKMTIARYYTPSGHEIQADGIKPDLLVDDVDTEAFEKAIKKKTVRREADMKNHLENSNKPKVNTAETGMPNSKKELLRDFQIAQAYNYLRASKVFHKMNETGAPSIKQ